MRGSEVVRCLSCGSTSAIRYEDDEHTWLEHLPEGRKSKPTNTNSQGLLAAGVLILIAAGCTGLANLGFLSSGTYGNRNGSQIGENGADEPSDLAPKTNEPPPSVAFDNNLPPLILPDAGGIIVAQISNAPVEGEVGAALLVAIDPETHQKLWEIPEVQTNSAVGWVGTAEHIVTLDEGGTIVIVNANTGATEELDAPVGRPQQLCKGDATGEVFLEVRGGANQRIDATTGNAEAFNGDFPCTGKPKPVEACRETDGGLTRSASCTRPSLAPDHPDIDGEFALTNDEQGVLVGRDHDSGTKIVLMGFDSNASNATWMTELPSDGAPLSEQRGAEMADGVIYVTARNPGEPWQLLAVDSENGDNLWSTELANSEDSAMDRGISVVDDTVYVLDDDTLHRVELETGALLADLGAALANPDE